MNKIIDKSSGKLVYQEKNRIRNIGNITPDEFKQSIADALDIEVDSIKVVNAVRDRTPSSYESSMYKSYVFTDPATKQETSLILTDPKKAQASKEKQEHSIIAAVNGIEGPKTIKSANNVTIPNVIKAAKSTAKSESYSHQPYADIDLFIKDGDLIKISAKGPDAPSAGGAGLAGILTLNNPKLSAFIKSFYEKVLKFAQNGDTTDKFIEVPKEFLVELFTGNEAMGGPIDYYYKGSLQVASTVGDNIIELDGTLTTPTEYANTYTYYFRLAKRRAGGKVTDATRPGTNIPVIYVDDHGKINSRLFVTSRRPENAKPITLDQNV